MKQIDDYLEQIYKLTEKIEQFLCSELEFDVKVEQVEEMMTRRAELFAAIDDSDGAKPRDYRRKIADIMALDRKVECAMQALRDEQKRDLENIRRQKRHAAKSKQVHNEYLRPQVESGYFINRKE